MRHTRGPQAQRGDGCQNGHAAAQGEHPTGPDSSGIPVRSDRPCAAAELVLVSQNVFTGESDQARPAAIGVRGDRICWVGAPDAVGTAACPLRADAEVRDFGDAFIMPGFHDAHVHFFHSALYASPLAEQFVGTSERDCVARLAPLAARRPAGSWLLAQGWREYLWQPARMPSKASLDAAYPDRPVAMYSGDAHTLWLNSRAMRELGLGPCSQPPAGGTYERDADGELTGIVRETAAMELMPRIMAAFREDELLEAYRGFLAELNARGVTAVCDTALSATPGLDFVRDDLFEKLDAAGQLTVRTHLFPTLLPGTRRLADLQMRLRGPLLQARGFKQFFDGVSSQHTAWLRDPYTNARFPGDCGRPTVKPSAMARMVCEAAAAGQPVRIHAIGDEAIHQALDIFESIEGDPEQKRCIEREDPATAQALAGTNADAGLSQRTAAAQPAFVLEHLENFQADDIARLAQLGVVASVQPRHITLDPGGPERDLGATRVPYMWPFRSLLDAGAVLAFGTDSPVTGIDPLAAVYTAVTRKDADTRQPTGGWLPDERITVAEALRAYTLGSATAAGRAHELGTLTPGKLADLTVLDRNPLTCDPEDIPAIAVQATYVAARRVYG